MHCCAPLVLDLGYNLATFKLQTASLVVLFSIEVMNFNCVLLSNFARFSFWFLVRLCIAMYSCFS